MKKNLLGFAAVVLAVAFTAFTTPKKSLIDLYRFTYQLTSFTQSEVQSETVANWGYGTLVTSSTDFSAACGGQLVKPCEIIVPAASVIDDGFGNKRMLSLDAGDPTSSNNVAITAALNSSTSTYYVSSGTNVSNKKNKN